MFAKLRYEFNLQVEQYMEENKIDSITKINKGENSIVDKLWRENWKNFEQHRQTILNLMLSKESEDIKCNYTQQEAKKIMQQAFMTFAIPQGNDRPSQFFEEVNKVLNDHTEVLEKMKKGDLAAHASVKVDPVSTKKDTQFATGFKRSATAAKPKKFFDDETKARAGVETAQAAVEAKKEIAREQEEKVAQERKPLTNSYVQEMQRMKSVKGHQMEDMAENMKKGLASGQNE